MKITAVKGFPVRLSYRNVFIVKVETGAGLCGLGEGGMAGRELAIGGLLDHFRRFLVGMGPRRIEHIWQCLYRSQYFESGKIEGAVIAAVDIALWDILGQALGVPVYQLLGGACRDRVPCFASVEAALTGPAYVEDARALVAQGWRRLRLFPGMPDLAATAGVGTLDQSPVGVVPQPPDATIYEPMESLQLAAHWVREVRRAVGPEVGLSIDFHHRLSVAEAALFCGQVADVHLMFLEEPIRAQGPTAYRQLRAMTPIPFAIGEECSSKWEFLPFIEEGLLNFARVDISNVGGLSEAKKVAGWCEAHYIDMMPHNPLGPVTTAASIHYSAAVANFAQLEYLHGVADGYPRDLFPRLPAIAGDSFPLPTAPGLGVTFDEEAAAAYAFDPWEAPHWRRRDGAVTNW